MLDAALLRRDFAAAADNLRRRGLTLSADEFTALDERRRAAQMELENLRAQRNTRAKEFARTPQPAAGGGADIKSQLREAQQEMDAAQMAMDAYLLGLPNLLQDSVPAGVGEDDNVEVHRWGTPRDFAFTPKDHVNLGAALDAMDFATAVKLAQSRFVVLRRDLAKMHRALANFMLDLHEKKHGYEEWYVPYLGNADTLQGTGQLPKFADDLFHIGSDHLYLIPTAEVALTNVARGRLFAEEELPLRLCAHTPCFRREAGAYGKDTRGMLRQHQFDKVEMVNLCAPAQSAALLKEMTTAAGRVLELLELPYRVVALCGGDIGFAAAQTFDLEVWMPGQNRYREISSCSNCGDFQARRMKARLQNDKGQKQLIHTLNGSGVAVGRALIAVMENHQQADGSIAVPAALRPFMNGITKIGGKNN